MFGHRVGLVAAVRFIGKHRLRPHPTALSRSIKTVEVEVAADSSCWHLAYIVTPAHDLYLPAHDYGAQDELWRTTCFELFVGGYGGAYREFNFAPDFAWAIYDFTGRRKGKRTVLPESGPHLVDMRVEAIARDYTRYYKLAVVVGRELCPAKFRRASLSAVIEEHGGRKSYWALAHPDPDKPDFHHPACFTLELPPPPCL